MSEPVTNQISTYGLAIGALGSSSFLNLSLTEYEEILSAKALLPEVLALEEKYDVLVSNYLDLEKTLNALAADHLIRADFDYQSMNDCRVLINQRVQNLLSASKAYLDHGAHHASTLESNIKDLALEFKKLCSREYDTRLGYRVGEALRNHAQHRDFPIGGFSTGGGWIKRSGGEEVLLHSIAIRLDVDGMREGKKTKPAVMKEIEGIGDKADARPLLRDYLAGLNAVHLSVREKVESTVTHAEGVIRNATEQFKVKFPSEKSAVGLAAVEREQSGKWISSTYLIPQMIERRHLFLRRNGSLAKLRQWHVSTESST